MSDVTGQYVTQAKRIALAQYVSIKSVLEQTLGHQGWLVSQRSFIAGARSLNEQDLHENVAYFKVPQVGKVHRSISTISIPLDLSSRSFKNVRDHPFPSTFHLGLFHHFLVSSVLVPPHPFLPVP